MTKTGRKSVVLCAAVCFFLLTPGSQRGIIAGSKTGAPGFPDRSRPTATASLLTWNTFLGGTGGDYGFHIALDGNGNTYVAGQAGAAWGAPVRAYGGGGADGFVAKLDANGGLVWHAFVGGTGSDTCYGIAADGSGNVYVTGASGVTWGSPLRGFSGSQDAFVAKLDANGGLVWNTFLGGSAVDYGQRIALYDGSLVVMGDSQGAWGSPFRPYSGESDVFAAKLDANGGLAWNTFLGSSARDYGYGLTVDGNGNAFITGECHATWGSPIDGFAGGATGGFVAKLNPNGGLAWNTFLGAVTGYHYATSVTSDGSGNAYVVGAGEGAWSAPLRASGVWFLAFAAKLNADGGRVWITFMGYSGTGVFGSGISLDESGNTLVSGSSRSRWGSPINAYSGGTDIFLAKLDPSGGLIWNTFLGGTGSENSEGHVADQNGNIWVAGYSPAAWGSPIRPYTADFDAFVAKVATVPVVTTAAVTSIGPTSASSGGNVASEGGSAITGRGVCWGTSANPTFAGSKTSDGAGTGSFTSSLTGLANNTSYHVRAYATNAYGTGYGGDVAFSTQDAPAISLSRDTLYFAGVQGGVSTKAQSVVISNMGKGQLAWTAGSDQAWLAAAPTSGTGTSAIDISVNTAGLAAGLAAGNYTGTVSIADPNAVNSPRTITVTLVIVAPALVSVPFGEFATPLDGTTGITGAIPVTGWVLDDIEVIKVEVKREPHISDPSGAIGPDGLVFIGNGIFVEGARPDVEASNPGYPLNFRAGWGYMLLTNFLPLQGNATFKLYAIATDREGNTVTLGTKMITCANAAATKPFGTIDTPAQGGSASGSTFVNFGWVLTPMPKTVPKNGSTIEVYVDSVKIGKLSTLPNVYDQYRVDVATAFPGLNNSNGPVGAFYLDTTKYANGVHTIYWVATDDQGAADGIGSRYFSILNTGGSAPAGSHREDGRPEVAIRLEESSRASRGISSAFASVEEILSFPLSFSALSFKRGFNLAGPPDMLIPDNHGTYHIDIKEVELLRISLNPGQDVEDNPLSSNNSTVIASDRRERGDLTFGKIGYSGYLVVDGELRPLPIGSTLDPHNGTFSWLPGPGFLGAYDLVFLKTDEFGLTRRIPVKVTIKPK